LNLTSSTIIGILPFFELVSSPGPDEKDNKKTTYPKDKWSKTMIQ